MKQAIFDDIHVGWKDQKYTIPANRVMGAIKRIENHVTLGELQDDVQRGTLRLSHIAAAYAALLRYAGAKDVTEEDVYDGMFDAGGAEVSVGAIGALLTMMVPKKRKPAPEAEPGEG